MLVVHIIVVANGKQCHLKKWFLFNKNVMQDDIFFGKENSVINNHTPYITTKKDTFVTKKMLYKKIREHMRRGWTILKGKKQKANHK